MSTVSRHPLASQVPDGFDIIVSPSGLQYPIKFAENGEPLFFVRRYDESVIRFQQRVKAATLIKLWLTGYRKYREKYVFTSAGDVKRGQLIGVPLRNRQ